MCTPIAVRLVADLTILAPPCSKGRSRLQRTHELVLAAQFRVGPGDPAALRAVARESLEKDGPSPELALVYLRIAGIHAFQLDYASCRAAAERAGSPAGDGVDRHDDRRVIRHRSGGEIGADSAPFSAPFGREMKGPVRVHRP